MILIVVLITACDKQQKTKPADVYSQEEMVQFLIDIQIAEARIIDLNLARDTTDQIFKAIEDSLFRKHGIDDSLYHVSYEYYLNDVEGLNNIYSAIVDSLSLRERLSKTSDTADSTKAKISNSTSKGDSIDKGGTDSIGVKEE